MWSSMVSAPLRAKKFHAWATLQAGPHPQWRRVIHRVAVPKLALHFRSAVEQLRSLNGEIYAGKGSFRVARQAHIVRHGLSAGGAPGKGTAADLLEGCFLQEQNG